jgi:hypothetical protein
VTAKLAYRVLGLGVSIVSGLIAGALFRWLWHLLARQEDTPTATDPERGWSEVLPSAALEGAVSGVVRAAAGRAGAAGFERVTGVWPG